MMIDNLMTVEAVSEYLGVPMATVYAWNSRGLGPRRYRVGKYVRYRREDVDAWLMEQVAPDDGMVRVIGRSPGDMAAGWLPTTGPSHGRMAGGENPRSPVRRPSPKHPARTAPPRGRPSGQSARSSRTTGP